MLGISKPVKHTGKSQIRKTQEALKTHSVNKVKTVYMISIQKKKTFSNTEDMKIKHFTTKTKKATDSN